MDVIDTRRTETPASTASASDAASAPQHDGAAAPAQPTPQQFYEHVVRRPDIREILARLAR